MLRYFDDGGAVASDASGVAALPAITNAAQTTYDTATGYTGQPSSAALDYFNTAQTLTPQGDVSQQADQTFQNANNAAQQGLGGLSILAKQYSSPYGIGALPVFNNWIERNHQQQLAYDDTTKSFSPAFTANQFNDPYENWTMYHGGMDLNYPGMGWTEIPDALKLYQEAYPDKPTPDWANTNRWDVLHTQYSGSNATPISWKDAWNSHIPTYDTAPEGYFNALDAYNTGMSKWNPTSNLDKFDPAAYAEYNAAAYNAMNQGIYDTNNPVYYQYMSPTARTAAAQSRANSLASSKSYYDRMKENNIAHAQQYGYSAADANSELDRRWAELMAESEAAAAAEQALQESITYNGGDAGGGGSSSGYNFGYASPNTGSSSYTTSTSSGGGYTPTNTNIGMGGVSGPANMGGGIAGPKLASGGEIYNMGYR